MSEGNVEVVREAVDALNRRDADAFVALVSPDVEWKEPADPFPGLRPIYRGRAEVREWLVEAFLEGEWESFDVEIEEITEASDDRVFFGLKTTARGVASGVETEIHTWSVTWHVDGKVARRQLFWTRDEALEAAGLSE